MARIYWKLNILLFFSCCILPFRYNGLHIRNKRGKVRCAGRRSRRRFFSSDRRTALVLQDQFPHRTLHPWWRFVQQAATVFIVDVSVGDRHDGEYLFYKHCIREDLHIKYFQSGRLLSALISIRFSSTRIKMYRPTQKWRAYTYQRRYLTLCIPYSFWWRPGERRRYSG